MRSNSTLIALAIIVLVALATPLCLLFGAGYGSVGAVVSVLGLAVAVSLRRWIHRS